MKETHYVIGWVEKSVRRELGGQSIVYAPLIQSSATFWK